MKVLKRLVLGLLVIVVLLFVVLAVFISTLDLNAYKEDIQKITKEQTGRELSITGELDASFFPWLGFSIGQVELSNAEGFGDTPFARMDAANVKLEVLPLLRSQVNVQSVELEGLALDLQIAADGKTNWDDLTQASVSTSTTTDDQTTEVEGGAPVIAALAVGGISVGNANVSWTDKQSGTDANLSGFELKTGAIELGKPFSLEAGFDLLSKSLAMQVRLDAGGDVTIDLEQQRYTLAGLEVMTSASGEGVPIDNAALKLGADITADLGKQQIDIASLLLDSLGIVLKGEVTVANLDTDPQITAALASDGSFSLLDVFAKLGIDAPETADETVLKKVSLSADMAASTTQANLKNLTIKLDDTTFVGSLAVPDLSGDLPPVRFDFKVNEIDLDRYLPPPSEEEVVATEETVPVATDTPIELPLELIRKLDIEGKFALDKIKVSNLKTGGIVVPVEAKQGVVKLDGVKASMYEGQLDARFELDAQKDTPVYKAKTSLGGIQAEPLLADFLQDEAPLSGKGDFGFDITSQGSSVNALKSALNGGYNLSFVDGAINGINVGYQLRRASAAIKGKKLSEEDKFKKTDFSALTMSGVFTDGVLSSDDLDLRAPALRLSGKGTVDLTKDYVDYKLRTLVTGTSKGQGGRDLGDLSGLKLSIPIRGHFDELSADFTKAIVQAMKDDLNEKLKAAEDKAKAQLKAKEAEAREKLKAEEKRAKEKLKALEDKKKEELEEKKKEELEKLKEKAQEKLKGLFN